MKARAVNKKVIKIIIISLSLCVVFALGLFLLFQYSFTEWTDYEYLTTLTTEDGKHDIIIEVSYPPLPPDGRVHLKVLCKDNSDGKEREYTELEFSVPKKGKWVWIDEETPEKCRLVFNHSDGRGKAELVWGDIFDTYQHDEKRGKTSLPLFDLCSLRYSIALDSVIASISSDATFFM